MAHNPDLAVGRLAVGDRLLALAGVPALPELVAVALERIGEKRADPATPLYNRRLGGDHTYIAHDLLVHNK